MTQKCNLNCRSCVSVSVAMLTCIGIIQLNSVAALQHFMALFQQKLAQNTKVSTWTGPFRYSLVFSYSPVSPYGINLTGKPACANIFLIHWHAFYDISAFPVFLGLRVGMRLQTGFQIPKKLSSDHWIRTKSVNGHWPNVIVGAIFHVFVLFFSAWSVSTNLCVFRVSTRQ